MKPFSRRLTRLLAVGSVVSLLAFGAVAQDFRIGFVNTDRIFREASLAKAAGSAPFAGSGVGRSYQPHWTPLHLDLLVEDLDVALARALAAGARQDGPIHNQPWGRLVGLRDPFGHGCCLLQWQGQGYAEVSETEDD